MPEIGIYTDEELEFRQSTHSRIRNLEAALRECVDRMTESPPPQPRRGDREALWKHATFLRDREDARRLLTPEDKDNA